jgi:hypothetical protein
MTMSKKFLFADLDDTLFQSRRKCPEGMLLAPAAYLKDGSAHSFLTPAQQSVLGLFLREMVVIPVTARNSDAYKRVRLGFENSAVVNYGGVILNRDGSPELEWLERSRALAAASLPFLSAIKETIISWAAATDAAVRVRIIEDFGVPFYVCAKSAEEDERVLDRIETMARAHWAESDAAVAIHRNGNNFSVLPRWLDKRYAVEYLVKRLRGAHGEIVTFGMGDSISDIGFMNICDYALIPNASQINRRLGGV